MYKKILIIFVFLFSTSVIAVEDDCKDALEENNVEQETIKKNPLTLWDSTVKNFIEAIEIGDLYTANWLVERSRMLVIRAMPQHYVHILLDISIYFGIEETVKRILTTFDNTGINEVFDYYGNGSQQTILQRALMKGEAANPNIVKYILDHPDMDINLHHGDKHILYYAIDTENPAILNMILYKEDLNYNIEKKYSAEENVTHLLLDAVLTDNPEVVLVFLKFDLMTKKVAKDVMKGLIEAGVYQSLNKKIRALLFAYINTSSV